MNIEIQNLPLGSAYLTPDSLLPSVVDVGGTQTDTKVTAQDLHNVARPKNQVAAAATPADTGTVTIDLDTPERYIKITAPVAGSFTVTFNNAVAGDYYFIEANNWDAATSFTITGSEKTEGNLGFLPSSGTDLLQVWWDAAGILNIGLAWKDMRNA